MGGVYDKRVSQPFVPIWMWSGYFLIQASQVVLVVKKPPANAGDIRNASSIPGSGRSPGGGHDNPLLQYFCLEKLSDGGVWQGTVHKVAKSWTQLK